MHIHVIARGVQNPSQHSIYYMSLPECILETSTFGLVFRKSITVRQRLPSVTELTRWHLSVKTFDLLHIRNGSFSVFPLPSSKCWDITQSYKWLLHSSHVALHIKIHEKGPLLQKSPSYKINNICSYNQTKLSIISLIKSTHLATGFDQTWSSSGQIYTEIKEVHTLL